MPWSLLGQHPEAGSLDVYRAVIEGAPVMLWLGDETGKCLFLNHRQRAFWGVSIDRVADFDWQTTVHPDDVTALEAPFRAAMQTHTELRVEARYRRFDGAYRVLSTSAAPRFGEDGRFLGMVGVNVDVTARREAEADLQTARDALALATAASRLGWGAWDFGTGATTWDARAREILDLDESETTIAAWLDRLPEEDREEVEAEMRRSAQTQSPFNLIYRVRRRDGSERRVQTTGSLLAPDRAPQTGTGLVRDVTEQWREQEFQRLLIGELNHRVKNLLGLVTALVSQTDTGGRTAAEFQSAILGRLRALAASSDLVVDSTDETIELQGLIEAVLEPHSAGRPDAVKLDGRALHLPVRHGRIVGLALHELATNAAKYGALSNPCGSVHLGWEMTGGATGRRLTLTWREAGGPTVEAPERSGFGSRLLERVVALETDGSAELRFEPSGLCYRLDLPLG